MDSAGRFAHVRWIGGASGAGKTTIALRLAAAFGLTVYGTDDAIAAHAADPGADTPLLTRFVRASMDERWLATDPAAMLASFPWFAGERFDRILGDLAALPATAQMLAEGFRLLPRLVAPLVDDPRQAVWLVPTPALRRAAFARRPAASQFWLRTSDPGAALDRLLERDRLFGEQVEREAERLGLKVIRVDRTTSVDETANAVARWLRLS